MSILVLVFISRWVAKMGYNYKDILYATVVTGIILIQSNQSRDFKL
jgi:hypothetical protein